MSGLFFIAIRRLRAPLVFIVAVFAVSTAGLTLIPGVAADGTAWQPSLFESFYFVTYTATTIGFGELPDTFSNLQRLWVTVIIYLSVIGWAYLLGNVLGLIQDKGFQAAIVAARFARAVRRMREPFYLLCGLGETGLMVAHALDRLSHRFVALDRDEARVLELDLGDFATDPPALAGDPTSPETLVTAGLLKRQCRGVLALMQDDRANLAIAVATRLLHPGVRSIARAESPETMASMAVCGVTEVINPYREFAERLALAMRAPESHRLLAWLTAPPGSDLPPVVPAPPGRWIVCGYGRFGTEMVQAIKAGGFAVTIVDPDQAPVEGLRVVNGYGTDEATLRDAGIAEAEGLVAGSDDDTANLAMAMAARQINPSIFVILRQNHARNRRLFEAFRAEMTMVPSEIIANECLAILRTRHLSSFLALVHARDNSWAAAVTARLEPMVGRGAPEFWSVRLDQATAGPLLDAVERTGTSATLGDLVRDPSGRRTDPDCAALLLLRGGTRTELPEDATELRAGDELLFAGRERGRQAMMQTLQNANAAEHVLTGRDPAASLVGRLLGDRFRPSGAIEPRSP